MMGGGYLYCMQALKDREKILSGELTIRREIVQELVRLLANDVASAITHLALSNRSLVVSVVAI